MWENHVSEPTAPPPGGSRGSTDRKALKQEAAAAKARSKAARPWYKKKRVIIPLALVVLIISINLGGGDGDTGEVTTEPAEETTTDESAEETTEDVPGEVPDDAEFAAIGEEARDGDFAFTVNRLENIGSTLEAEDEFMDDAQASGEFYVMELTVENIGNEAQNLSASNQYLYDAGERRFSASDDFEVVLAIDTPIFELLNPGAVTDGRIVFDVPEGVEIEFAELHDSAFSGGVLVDLRE
jgi:hypothetical protein